MTQDEIRKLPHKVVDGVAILLTEEEIAFHTAPQPLDKIKENLNLRIKNYARSSILANYSEMDQRNILMSGNAEEISKMNEVILGIRTASKNMRESLSNMTREELENININF